jgi:hypothetical protein
VPHYFDKKVDAILAARSLGAQLGGDVDVVEVPGKGWAIGQYKGPGGQLPSVCEVCGEMYFRWWRGNKHRKCRRRKR